jgi:hypothetical protein
MNETIKRNGRPRIHADNAARQRAWRQANQHKYIAELARRREQRKQRRAAAAMPAASDDFSTGVREREAKVDVPVLPAHRDEE